jgi:hypothetical protein
MDRAALISCFEDTVKRSRKGKLARETERAIAASVDERALSRVEKYSTAIEMLLHVKNSV